VNLEPGAYGVQRVVGLRVYPSADGNIQQAMAAFSSGQLRRPEHTSAEVHAGMEGRVARGRGRVNY